MPLLIKGAVSQKLEKKKKRRRYRVFLSYKSKACCLLNLMHTTLQSTKQAKCKEKKAETVTLAA